ncbi:MAG TPA: NAD(+) diphosphatase [Alphaproteobacteria bacterium]|jgi:NAD+ diphosphatase|nr:NAD(+) diphosphatase [Alphaproteobacteria bacterium]
MSFLSYSRNWLSLAHQERQDDKWLQNKKIDPTSRWLPLWQNQCFINPASLQPIFLSSNKFSPSNEIVLLGLDQLQQAVFAVDLSFFTLKEAFQLVEANFISDVRHLVARLNPVEADIIARARGLLYWHHRHQFCGVCGCRTMSCHGGAFRQCQEKRCETIYFPQISPAIITLIELPGSVPKCLLARHRESKPGQYSTLAGFVEVGENLENAVHREVKEEVGLSLNKVIYQASQGWPFPGALMVGFFAEAQNGDVQVDRHELIEAKWFTIDEVRERLAATSANPFNNDSIEKFLVTNWVQGYS